MQRWTDRKLAFIDQQEYGEGSHRPAKEVQQLAQREAGPIGPIVHLADALQTIIAGIKMHV